MKEHYLDSKVVTREQGVHHERTGFSYDEMVSGDEGYGLSVIIGDIHPGEGSPSKIMTSAIRIYLVAGGSGQFWIDGEEHEAKEDTTFIVMPGSAYSFTAGEKGMKLHELNIYTENHVQGDKPYELDK